MNESSSNDFFDLEYLFEASPDLICIAGYDGYFKKINQAVSETLGYTKEELLAKPINFFIHSQDILRTSINRDLIRTKIPLLNFENRYITKSGEIVWLVWTSVPIEKYNIVFGIAKNITYRKKIEEYKRISNILTNSDKQPRGPFPSTKFTESDSQKTPTEYSPADQAWLSEFEKIVRKHTGKTELNLHILSSELAISERQLFRRLKTIMGVTPNHFIRVIRLNMALEAAKSGKYRTVAEIANVAGFETPSYFSKLFKNIYNINIAELL